MKVDLECVLFVNHKISSGKEYFNHTYYYGLKVRWVERPWPIMYGLEIRVACNNFELRFMMRL